MSKRILVTGGAGYIGSHTLVDLLENGFEVFCVDNLSRSNANLLQGVKKITGKDVSFQQLELTDENAVHAFFKNQKFDGIIHFAAFKSVGESVLNPLLYYKNNIQSLTNVLSAAQKFKISNFIFSSSCSVYGDLSAMPVTEATALGKAHSPYGRTKQIGEEILKDVSKNSNLKIISLRYFNPVGAHPSAFIGEIPFGKPSNVIPAITQFASGRQKEFCILGNDYPTPDGTCIRDYVHVCDVARAHRLALEYASNTKHSATSEVINLGSEMGLSVKEVVASFEAEIQQKIKFTIAARRDGDVAVIYTTNKLALERLKWQPIYSLREMLRTAWEWEKRLIEIAGNEVF